MPEFDICKGDEIQSKNYQINKIQKSIKKVAAQQIQKYACLSVNVASVIYFRAITNFILYILHIHICCTVQGNPIKTKKEII